MYEFHLIKLLPWESKNLVGSTFDSGAFHNLCFVRGDAGMAGIGMLPTLGPTVDHSEYKSLAWGYPPDGLRNLWQNDQLLWKPDEIHPWFNWPSLFWKVARKRADAISPTDDCANVGELIAFFYSYFGHCLSVYPWLNFGLSPRRPQVVWGPLRWDWAIFCHIGLGLRSRVWSAREKSLEILRHGRQLNPAMERTDRETHSFSHWAIMIRATERTDSEIHSFSNWAIVTDLLIAWILYVCLTTKLNTCDSGWVPIPCLHNSRFDRLHKTNPSSSLLRISMTGQLSGVVQVPRRCPVQCQEFAGALDSCQEWCRNWPIES